jgi:hypothetical protein
VESLKGVEIDARRGEVIVELAIEICTVVKQQTESGEDEEKGCITHRECEHLKLLNRFSSVKEALDDHIIREHLKPTSLDIRV